MLVKIFTVTLRRSYLATLPGLLEATVAMLDSPTRNLHKAASHLLRNLAWKADKPSKVDRKYLLLEKYFETYTVVEIMVSLITPPAAATPQPSLFHQLDFS